MITIARSSAGRPHPSAISRSSITPMSRRHPRNPLLVALVAAATVAQFGCGPTAGMAPDPAAVAAAGQPGPTGQTGVAGQPGGTPGAAPNATPTTAPGGGPSSSPAGQPGSAPASSAPTGGGGSDSTNYEPLTFSAVTGHATFGGTDFAPGATVTVENAVTDEPAQQGDSTRTLARFGDDTIVLQSTAITVGEDGAYTFNVANLKEGMVARVTVTDGTNTVTALVEGNDDAAAYRLRQLFADVATNEASLVLDLMARSVLKLSANLTEEARATVTAQLLTSLEALRADIETALATGTLRADIRAAATTFTANESTANTNALLGLVKDVVAAAPASVATAAENAVVSGLQTVVQQQADATKVQADVKLSNTAVQAALAFVAVTPNLTAVNNTSNGTVAVTLNGSSVVTAAPTPVANAAEVRSVPNFAPTVSDLVFETGASRLSVTVDQDPNQFDIAEIVARLDGANVTEGNLQNLVLSAASNFNLEGAIAPATIELEDDAGVEAEAYTLPDALGGGALPTARYGGTLKATVSSMVVRFAKVRLFTSAANRHYLVINYTEIVPNANTTGGSVSTLQFDNLLSDVVAGAKARIYMKAVGGGELYFDETITKNTL